MEGGHGSLASSAASPTGTRPSGLALSLSPSPLPPPGPPSRCRFGGGPAVNHLYVCSICQVEIEALAKRRRIEIDTFIKVRAGGGGAPLTSAGATREFGD